MAKRCLGCMKMKNQSPVCEHCGFNENIPNFPHQLPLDTLLRGQYRVGKVLGQGGFGITYMGWDENLDVPIAIKEYFPNGFVNRECTHSLSVTCGDSNRQLFYHNRERFIREARALAKLRDVPGIVRIHNFFQENDTAYIVMEYVEGIDLKRYIRMRNRTLTASEALNILKPVMEALSHVHEAGLVHRDITPDNIMILPDGSAKLLDFGAVREVLDADADKQLSQATEAILKQGFAPMEQYQNKGSLGPWTDVYALCATMYYCITGRVPPDAPARLLDNKPLDWNLVPGLNQQQIAALERGMAILPKQRTASVAQLLNELYNGAQPVAQNYVNSAIQGNAMPNDFRNAYSASAYSNSIPDPISNTGRNPGYPNHTVPLDANPLGGYQAAQSARPISGYQAPVTPIQPIPSVSYAPPVTKKKSKKGLIIGIAAACVAAVVGLGVLGNKDSTPTPGTPHTPVIQAPAEIPDASLSQPGPIDTLLSQGPAERYTFQNGWRMESYFDKDDHERCRLIYNKDGKLEYKSIAEYHASGETQNHWLYDGEDNLIRQDTYTRDKDGNIQAYVQLDRNGSVMEAGSYSYDRSGNLLSRTIQAEDGTVLRTGSSTYDDKGNELTRVWNYRDGSRTEYTYNENGNTKTQHSYDSKGNLERYWEYKSDAQGRSAGSIMYSPSGEVETTSQNQYDQNDNLIVATYYNANGSLSYTNEYIYIGKDIQIGYNYISSYGETNYEYVDDILSASILQFEHHTGEYSNYDTTRYYDDFSNQTKAVSYNFDGSLNRMEEYSYDIYGTMQGYTSTSYSDDRSYQVYEYNGDYDPIGKQEYDANGNLETWTEYEYDSRDLCVKEITYKADGSTDNVLEILYDSNNEPTKRSRTTYNDDGTRNVYVSDGDYNTLSSTTYDAAGNVKYSSTYQYEWTDFGEPAKAYVYDKNGKLSYWMEYFYDENGNYLDLETHFD